MSIIDENLINNVDITVKEYIRFLKNKLMNEQPKYYLQDEEIEFVDFIKTLEVLKDYRIPYSLTEDCYDKKITVNLYVCKNSLIEAAKIIREYEVRQKINK